ncbi:MAG: hypothetical protein VB835_17905, partial [Pirellulales bacterium]
MSHRWSVIFNELQTHQQYQRKSQFHVTPLGYWAIASQAASPLIVAAAWRDCKKRVATKVSGGYRQICRRCLVRGLLCDLIIISLPAEKT